MLHLMDSKREEKRIHTILDFILFHILDFENGKNVEGIINVDALRLLCVWYSEVNESTEYGFSRILNELLFIFMHNVI